VKDKHPTSVPSDREREREREREKKKERRKKKNHSNVLIQNYLVKTNV
jgi:hypothetical protein